MMPSDTERVSSPISDKPEESSSDVSDKNDLVPIEGDELSNSPKRKYVSRRSGNSTSHHNGQRHSFESPPSQHGKQTSLTHHSSPRRSAGSKSRSSHQSSRRRSSRSSRRRSPDPDTPKQIWIRQYHEGDEAKLPPPPFSIEDPIVTAGQEELATTNNAEARTISWDALEVIEAARQQEQRQRLSQGTVAVKQPSWAQKNDVLIAILASVFLVACGLAASFLLDGGT